MSELRRDPFGGGWVVIAPDRHWAPLPPAPELELFGACPLCPGHEAATPPELYADRPTDGPGARANGPGWHVRVFPHRQPMLRIEGGADREGAGPHDRMPGLGAHELVVESSDHARGLEQLDGPAITRVLRAVRERVADLSRDSRFRCAVVFKQHRAAAGALLAHGHTQIVALPVHPPRLESALIESREHFQRKERCLTCDLLRHDRADGRRIIAESDSFTVVAPWAPRVPFETWIVPRQHRAAFEEASPHELQDLGAALAITLSRLARALGDPPYQLALHSAPFRDRHAPWFHYRIEIAPRLRPLDTLAAGTGLHVHPIPPEEAAQTLRAAAATSPNPAGG